MSNRRSPRKPWLAILRRPNVADIAWIAFYRKQQEDQQQEDQQQEDQQR